MLQLFPLHLILAFGCIDASLMILRSFHASLHLDLSFIFHQQR